MGATKFSISYNRMTTSRLSNSRFWFQGKQIWSWLLVAKYNYQKGSCNWNSNIEPLTSSEWYQHYSVETLSTSGEWSNNYSESIISNVSSNKTWRIYNIYRISISPWFMNMNESEWFIIYTAKHNMIDDQWFIIIYKYRIIRWMIKNVSVTAVGKIDI